MSTLASGIVMGILRSLGLCAWVVLFVVGRSANALAAQTLPVEKGALLAATYAHLSCPEIYNEITALIEQKRADEATFLSDENTRIASYAASTYTPLLLYPGLAYLGYSSVQYVQRRARVSSLRQRINTLRALVADKRCFIK